MTSRSDLSGLLNLVEMRYAAQNRAFQEIVAEENSIRAELQKISAQDRAADVAQGTEMRAIGADVIWKAWVGRSRRSLNMRLAQVLAKKEHHLRQIERAYGKVLVTRELLENQVQSETNSAQQSQLETAVSQHLSRIPKRQ